MPTTRPTNGDDTPENGKPEPSPTETATDTLPQEPAGDPRLEQARKESAKYRRQLRTAEDENETLRAELDTVYRQRIQDELPEGMPAKGFWLTYKDTPRSLLNDDLQPDKTKLREAIDTAYDQLGLKAPEPRLLASAYLPLPETGLGTLHGTQGWQGVIRPGIASRRR